MGKIRRYIGTCLVLAGASLFGWGGTKLANSEEFWNAYRNERIDSVYEGRNPNYYSEDEEREYKELSDGLVLFGSGVVTAMTGIFVCGARTREIPWKKRRRKHGQSLSTNRKKRHVAEGDRVPYNVD